MSAWGFLLVEEQHRWRLIVGIPLAMALFLGRG